MKASTWLQAKVGKGSYQELSKLLIPQWSKSLKSWKRTTPRLEKIWILICTRTKFLPSDWNNWRSSSTTASLNWRTRRKSKRKNKKSRKLRTKSKRLSISMLTHWLNMKGWMSWSRFVNETRPTTSKRSLNLSWSAITSKKWLRLKANQFWSLKRKSKKWRNWPRSLCQITAKR